MSLAWGEKRKVIKLAHTMPARYYNRPDFEIRGLDFIQMSGSEADEVCLAGKNEILSEYFHSDPDFIPKKSACSLTKRSTEG